MKKRIIAIALCLPLCFASFSACTQTVQTADNDGKLTVVTTGFPQYDLTREVVGDIANIKMLLAPGAEPHSYEPTPQDILTIRNADLFVCGGGESDAWVNSVLASVTDDSLHVVAFMDCITPIEEEDITALSLGASESNEDEDEIEYDEHVWTSPVNAKTLVNSISKAMSEIDPDNSLTYSQNANLFCENADSLDKAFRDVVANAQRKVFVFADRYPLLYFSREYGLDYIAAYPGCSSETEANPVVLARLISRVESENIPVVLKIEMSSNSMADAVASATGAEIMTFYSCQTISQADFLAGETYLSLMQRNVETLKAALGQTA